MILTQIIDTVGEDNITGVLGVFVGLIFGFMAQRSKFCLRAAVVEVFRGSLGQKFAIWLLTFSVALLASQGFMMAGYLDVSSSRMLSAAGTLSGAIVGGLCFGVGMVLARGCSSRLLVLAAGGNLRALLSGLIFVVVAQASLSGVLSPLRTHIGGWWPIDANYRDIKVLLHLGEIGGVILGVLAFIFALYITKKSALSRWLTIGAMSVGFTIALAWLLNYQVSLVSFSVTQVKSLSFSGPAADVLMLVLSQANTKWNFDIGLIPGVFAGAFISALLFGDIKLEGFKDGYSMRRYIVGAVLMGFGAMLAGGCAVGSGVSGGAILSLTSWITLFSMWAAAGLTDYIVDRKQLVPVLA